MNVSSICYSVSEDAAFFMLLRVVEYLESIIQDDHVISTHTLKNYTYL